MSMTQQEFVGARLRSLRTSRRLSLGEVARETGISASSSPPSMNSPRVRA